MCCLLRRSPCGEDRAQLETLSSWGNESCLVAEGLGLKTLGGWLPLWGRTRPSDLRRKEVSEVTSGKRKMNRIGIVLVNVVGLKATFFF